MCVCTFKKYLAEAGYIVSFLHLKTSPIKQDILLYNASIVIKVTEFNIYIKLSNPEVIFRFAVVLNSIFFLSGL